MNKKIYSQPSITVVQMVTQGFLALSADGDNLKGAVSNEAVTSGWADSRSFDLDD